MKIIRALDGNKYRIGKSIQTQIEHVRDNTFWNPERY